MGFKKMIRKDSKGRLKRRDDILNRVFTESMDNSLDSLLNVLNHHNEFASMWFCGSRIDHSRCLGSKSIGWGISALPNDIDKASMPKYHPHQVEIMIPIQGSVCVETYTPHAGLYQTTIKQGKCDYITINSAVCHRIRPIQRSSDHAAFFFVKTNVGREPQEVGVLSSKNIHDACLGCVHHADRYNCLMFHSYQDGRKDYK
jgi:hypothetical protein